MNYKKREITKISIFITSIFIIFLSITYALINQTVFGTKRQVITSSTLSIELEEEKELTIENALPMYDEVGKIQKDSFHFKLINNSNYKVDYTLHLSDITKDDREKLNYEDVKYYLTKNEQDLKLELLSERTEDIIDQGVIASNQTINYTLRFWIDSKVENNNDIHNKTLSFQLIAKVTEHTPEKYTITYHTGTDEVIENQIKTEDKDIILPTVTSAKENHTFLGWSREENGKVEYQANGTYQGNTDEDLYAVWGINYLYNRGNQFRDDTGGWNYTKTFTTEKYEYDNATFGTDYIEWNEMKTLENGINYYGEGYFETNHSINLENAKAIHFEYTVPNAGTDIYLGIKYYPLIKFSLLDTFQKKVWEETIELDAANNNLTTFSIEIDDQIKQSVLIIPRVTCSTMSTYGNTMIFRLYSVYVTY